MRSSILILVMSLVTILLRFLPFFIFKNKTPKYISYLGKVLPSAIIGMLVVYCLKDANPLVFPFGLPEFFSAIIVIGLQIWKRNSLISILSGTVVYMLLVQLVF